MKLARAITIHKSQWLTFDNCCIDMWRWAFANGQTYVALSRCRNLNGIRLKSHITLNDVRTDKRVIDFMQKK
jgi:ATP-dependent exoDNAse (exonuclease V) alpha subunit